MPSVEISLILPCYNEGPSFEESIKKILNILSSLKEKWEIVFVEDFSDDGTRKKLDKMSAGISNSTVIYHKRNEGRGKSVVDGIKKAKGEICGFIDVDLEVSPSYIPLFIEAIKKGNDVAVAKRFYESGGSIARFIASKGYSAIVKFFLDLPIRDTEAGYKFFNRRKILPIIREAKNKHWFWDTEICALAHYNGLKLTEIPVLFKRRFDKKSTVKMIPDTLHFGLNLIKFKVKLLSNEK